ncbi:MAG: type II/IV secretion system protein [Gemmataceae bacterium]|nr:type II/IV secretion system protein [Gemmataceae bacterium]
MNADRHRSTSAAAGGHKPRVGAAPRGPVVLYGFAPLPALALLGQVGPDFRGPGDYFSLPAIFLLVAAYVAWIATCDWVNRDAEHVGLDTGVWNGALLGAGALGLLFVWLLPVFFLGFVLFLALYACAALGYLVARDRKVPLAERLLTEKQIQKFFASLLTAKDAKPRKTKVKAAAAQEDAGGGDDNAEAPRPRIRFIGRSGDQKEEDPERVARAESSRGYRAAMQMVYEAIQRRVTDIHLEPTKDEMAVRFRVDGILHGSDPFTRPMGDAVVNIFKVLCDMNITERRKPQDGSFSAEVEGRTVDFRVATAGSVVGEKLVMRVLDRAQQVLTLTQVGMRDKVRDQTRELVTQPHGMFIVCGPTGAGKTTTLYAALSEIDRYQKNVLAIENPVEYRLEHVTQIEVNTRAGKTFATELRSILRQDPDVILIGEVRDQETAEIACQAAQTGHMVFTTLHANDAVTAIGRLLDLGVQPFMIASALTAVLGQRLVRLLCPYCKVKYRPNPDLLQKLNLPVDKIKFFYRPPEPNELPTDAAGKSKPCDRCDGSGYHGRTGIFELLVVTDGLRALIRENPNLNALKQEAIRGGLRPLQEDGMRQVIEGRTSIQELLRVSK